MKLTRALAGAAVLSLCVLLAVQPAAVAAAAAGGKVESTVRKEVGKAIRADPSVGPALIRLVFHDCWVNVCSVSVLISFKLIMQYIGFWFDE